MTEDAKWMARCLQLARCGAGSVSPNPMVGAVLVCDGKIIGEGYHRRYGQAHAEVNAIRSVGDESWLRRATLYVSLEPCSHYGKTPPCASLIIEKKIPRVVVACLDPFPEVAGRGVRMLEEAGVRVTVGVLEKEALELNERFVWFHRNRSPYIIAKWAQSADGFLDRIRRTPDEAPEVFSSSATRRLVHRLRTEVDAILVGARTAWLDNPSLTARYWAGRSPVRILLDPDLSVPPTIRLYDGSVPTYVFTRTPADSRKNVTFVPVPPGSDAVKTIREFLYARGLQTLLVEGGAQTLQSFLTAGVNEARVEVADTWLCGGVRAPRLSGAPAKIVSAAGSSIRIYKGFPVKTESC